MSAPRRGPKMARGSRAASLPSAPDHREAQTNGPSWPEGESLDLAAIDSVAPKFEGADHPAPSRAPQAQTGVACQRSACSFPRRLKWGTCDLRSSFGAHAHLFFRACRAKAWAISLSTNSACDSPLASHSLGYMLIEVRTAASISESVCALGRCDDVTQGGGVPGASFRHYADGHD